jgi:hypothetical protein
MNKYSKFNADNFIVLELLLLSLHIYIGNFDKNAKLKRGISLKIQLSNYVLCILCLG